MTTPLLILLSVAACAVILWRGEPALNRLGPATPLIVRLALWLIVIGACAQLLGLVMGIAPQWPSVVLQSGIAALLYCERRLRGLVPHPRRRTPRPGAF